MRQERVNSMTDKSLKGKAIDIKGKQYVLVADRIIYFNEQYPNGSITTDLISDPTSGTVIVKAYVFPESKNAARTFTGYSQAVIGDGMVNKTAALENAETSAVGRALAMMGIGVIDSVASVDEINKAQGSTGTREMKFATPKQITWLRNEAVTVTGLEEQSEIDDWIEDTLGARPEKISLKSVKTGVDRIRQVGLDARNNVKEEDAVDVTDQDLLDLKEGRIPF